MVFRGGGRLRHPAVRCERRAGEENVGTVSVESAVGRRRVCAGFAGRQRRDGPPPAAIPRGHGYQLRRRDAGLTCLAVCPAKSKPAILETVLRTFGKRLRLTLEMIKFEHSVFALPFALTGALLAWRESGLSGSDAGWKVLWIV